MNHSHLQAKALETIADNKYWECVPSFDLLRDLFRTTWTLLPALMISQIAGAAEFTDGVASPVPPFSYYSGANGLSQSQVNDVTQDSVGALWVATERGISRFDGTKFDYLTIADGLPDNRIKTVIAGRDGELWTGDRAGNVSLIQRGEVIRSVGMGDDQASVVTRLAQTESAIFAGTSSSGLMKVSRTTDGLRMEKVLDFETPILALQYAAGRLWFISNKQLFSMDPVAGAAAELVLPEIEWSHIDADNTHWLVNAALELGRLRNGRFESIADLAELGRVHDFLVDTLGSVWVAGRNGLVSLSVSTGTSGNLSVDKTFHSSVRDVRSLFLDRESVLWVGTHTRLAEYLGDQFRHYILPGGDRSSLIWSIEEDREGRMYFGTTTQIVRVDPDNNYYVIDEEQGLPTSNILAMLMDDADRLWLSSMAHGIYHWNVGDDRVHFVPKTKDWTVGVIAKYSKAEIILGTEDNGAYLLNKESLDVRPLPGTAGHTVYAAASTPDGTIWAAADGKGLIRLTPTESGNFTHTVIGTDAGLGNPLFNHIAVVSNDELWIGGAGGGLYHYVDGAVESIGQHTPLKDQTVYLVYPMGDRLFAGGELGLYEIDLESYATIRFGPKQGFLGVETNSGAIHLDSRGYLWIGTVTGATRMDLAAVRPQVPEIRPAITHLRTASTGRSISDRDTLSWHDRDLEARFVAISIRDPSAVEYSYRMAGLSPQWKTLSKPQVLSFSGLSWGTYSLEVKARYKGQPWGDAVSSGSFVIEPPFWRQWWFIILAVATLFAAVFGIVRWRTARMNRNNLRLRREVEERTRNIEDARKHLAQSNLELSRQITVREKAEQARAAMEERFKRAFTHLPIGLGLLDNSGNLLEVNKSLQAMLWPDRTSIDALSFDECVEDGSRESYWKLKSKIQRGKLDRAQAELNCINTLGESLLVVVTVGPVPDDEGDLKHFALQVEDVTAERRLTKELEFHANYDSLTELMNRRAFEECLNDLLSNPPRDDKPSFLMFMDLDQFKVVNDTSGHAAGDELLRQIGSIIQSNVRNNDFVGRLGGDEFGLILRSCTEERARIIAENIRAEVADHQFSWGVDTHRVGVSIGAVAFHGGNADRDDLEQLADAACYIAKEKGRNCVHFVQGSKDQAMEHRGETRWVHRIRNAMENGQFSLYCQRIQPVQPNEDEPERMEVLLRLKVPDTSKVVLPGTFLPAAERYGLSVELDQWVVDNLLRTLFVYESVSGLRRQYWINLSGASIGDVVFADSLLRLMEECPLPRGMINFEITETSVIRSLTDAARLISRLREMGSQIALDDFGSGLSSLSYLKKLDVDYLKIDGMFVRDIVNDPIDQIFVKSIIDIAHKLGIKTIAEFVENEETLSMVSSLGVDYVQGFGIHRPEIMTPVFPVRQPEATLAGDSAG